MPRFNRDDTRVTPRRFNTDDVKRDDVKRDVKRDPPAKTPRQPSTDTLHPQGLVTRFEVIDDTEGGGGRILTRHGITVTLSYQDDGRTLKVFLTERLAARQRKQHRG